MACINGACLASLGRRCWRRTEAEPHTAPRRVRRPSFVGPAPKDICAPRHALLRLPIVLVSVIWHGFVRRPVRLLLFDRFLERFFFQRTYYAPA